MNIMHRLIIIAMYAASAAILAVGLMELAHGADYQLGVDTSKPVSCTDADSRTDGTPLAKSEIDRVDFIVRNSAGDTVATIPMPGGCQTLTLDFTGWAAGTYDQTGITYTLDGLNSVEAPVPTNFTLLAKPPAPPNPPIMGP